MKLKLHLLTVLVGSLGALVLAPSASAQRINNRAELNALLGGNQTMEDFESFNLPYDTFVFLGQTLDDTSVVQGQGPGLVADGATYSAPGANVVWLGVDRFDPDSRTIQMQGSSTGPAQRITYTPPVSAMGLDVINAPISYYGTDGVSVAVFDTSGALVGSFTEDLDSQRGSRNFIGFQHSAGIGFVELRNVLDPDFGPTIDRPWLRCRSG